MIRIIGESADPADCLKGLLSLDGEDKSISNLITAIRQLNNHIQDPAGKKALLVGAQTIATGLSPLADLKKVNNGVSWHVFSFDEDKDLKAILTVMDFRKWILDYTIPYETIVSTLNGIYAAGKELRDMIDRHTQQEEMDQGKAGYVSVSLSGNAQIIEDLYRSGSKGRGYNAYGSYERLLSVMLGGQKFPKDGKDGSGDIVYPEHSLVEVKCVDGNKLLNAPHIPNENNACLLLVRGGAGHGSFEVLCFKNQTVLDDLLGRGTQRVTRKDGSVYVSPDKLDGESLAATFKSMGQLRGKGYRSRFNKRNMKVARLEDDAHDAMIDFVADFVNNASDDDFYYNGELYELPQEVPLHGDIEHEWLQSQDAKQALAAGISKERLNKMLQNVIDNELNDKLASLPRKNFALEVRG